MLKYGIPEFRLPNRIVEAEIKTLEAQGVEFVTDCVVGKTLSVDDLKAEGYEGIFVASGAGLPNFMGIPGENANGILSSNEYLTRCNLMDASNPEMDTPIHVGRHVVVVGGGNTAMDSVRTALRLGAATATIVYRRSEEEMPARRSPVPIPGATETLDCDLVVVSIGVSPNPIVPRSIAGLELGRKNTIAVDEDMRSNLPTIFAGGDIVRGGATVILAMGDGRRAAQSMARQLRASS